MRSDVQITGVVLGKGAANLCKDGRKTLCAIVLSDEFGLVRIYPLNVCDDINVWSKVSCCCRESESDNRSESWSVSSAEKIGKVVSPHEKRLLLDSIVLRSGDVDPFDFQNKMRQSIAVVRPEQLGGSMKPRELFDRKISAEDDECVQPWVITQCKMPQKPFLEWRSGNGKGKEHVSHIVAQEVYEGLRKNQASPYCVFDNIRISNPDWSHWLILGNLKHRRTIWVVVHVHRLKKQPKLVCS